MKSPTTSKKKKKKKKDSPNKNRRRSSNPFYIFVVHTKRVDITVGQQKEESLFDFLTTQKKKKFPVEGKINECCGWSEKQQGVVDCQIIKKVEFEKGKPKHKKMHKIDSL